MCGSMILFLQLLFITFTNGFSSNTYSFLVPLTISNKRPKPTSFIETFNELWNDPRPISAIISKDRSNVGELDNGQTIPYCIISDEFDIDGELFQILLYPRGRFVQHTSSPASAYLRYLPKQYGDEVDIGWRLQLCNGNDDEPLPISTSGGLPRSNTTWSAAMTFSTEMEAVESSGRTTDWGSSIWNSQQICNSLDDLYCKGEITVFDKRSGESSFAWPPFQRGAIGAVVKAAKRQSYKVGEVIVPTAVKGLETEVEALKEQFVYPGIDYRIMTMTDKDDTPIFTTDSLDNEDDKARAILALRPCGWKTQQQLWKKKGKRTDWPVEVTAGQLSKVTTTRFNFDSTIPRITSAFQRDWFTYSLALAVALTPIPATLLARNFISLYDIPSASMEPTFLKGDVLLVEKLPGVYKRSHLGDVVLFQPPDSLREVMGSNTISSTSLFVKRIVGLPGDTNIKLVDDNNVKINGVDAVGPDRSLCEDEPLRLIDKLLENGKGKDIDKLADDELYVLGDCKAVSVDSRVWGPLPTGDVKGRPIARVWPPSRFALGPF